MTYNFHVWVSRVTITQPTRKVLQEMGSGEFPSLKSVTEEKQETRSFCEGGVGRGDRSRISQQLGCGDVRDLGRSGRFRRTYSP